MRRRWLGRRVVYWVGSNFLLAFFAVVAVSSPEPGVRVVAAVVVVLEIAIDVFWVATWLWQRRQSRS